LWRRHDPELFSGVVDDPDFPYSDAFVDANTIITSWAAVESDKSSSTKEVRTSNFEVRT